MTAAVQMTLVNEPEPTTLQELVEQRLREMGDLEGRPMPLRRAAEKSQGLLSYEALRRITRGTYHSHMGDKAVAGLALILDLPVERIYRVMDRAQYLGEWTPPSESGRLTVKQRQMLDEWIKELARLNDAAESP